MLAHQQENVSYWNIYMETLNNAWDKYKDGDVFSSLIYGFGFGDGGGGPTQGSIEVAKCSNELGILPKMEYSTVADYYKSLEKDIQEHDGPGISTWHGELYLELHRGTYTSQSKLKFYNRMIENKLKVLEMHMSKTLLDGKLQKNINVKLEKLWESFLLNQFHDIIPGTTIKEAVWGAQKLYDDVLERCTEINAEIFTKYDESSELKILNPTTTATNYIMDITGSNIEESFSLGDRKFSYVYGTKPLAYSKFTNDEAVTKTVELSDKYEFDKYIVTFDEEFNIISLWNKKNGVELVDGKFNEFKVYEDKPINWNAWDIDVYYTDKGYDAFEFISAEVYYETRNVLVIKVFKTYMKSKITQLIILSKHDDFIDFKTMVDWNESEKLLRTDFENKIKCDYLLCDTQYGNQLRQTHCNTSWDMARFEFVAQKFVTIEDASTSYSLVNNGKYGFNYINNTLGMTLIKAGTYPDPKQDIGIHEFGYAIKITDEKFINSDVEDFATLYNTYDTIVKYDIDEEAIIEIKNDNLAIDAIKLNSGCDKLVLRVHDYKNMRGRLDISRNVFNVLNSLEETIDYNIEVGNYEIKTFEIE